MPSLGQGRRRAEPNTGFLAWPGGAPASQEDPSATEGEKRAAGGDGGGLGSQECGAGALMGRGAGADSGGLGSQECGAGVLMGRVRELTVVGWGLRNAGRGR